jgi:hypothetical protein
VKRQKFRWFQIAAAVGARLAVLLLLEALLTYRYSASRLDCYERSRRSPRLEHQLRRDPPPTGQCSPVHTLRARCPGSPWRTSGRRSRHVAESSSKFFNVESLSRAMVVPAPARLGNTFCSFRMLRVRDRWKSGDSLASIASSGKGPSSVCPSALQSSVRTG